MRFKAELHLFHTTHRHWQPLLSLSYHKVICSTFDKPHLQFQAAVWLTILVVEGNRVTEMFVILVMQGMKSRMKEMASGLGLGGLGGGNGMLGM